MLHQIGFPSEPVSRAEKTAVAQSWQARRESNPQQPVLETGALPIELLACGKACLRHLVSRCNVRLRSAEQNFLSSKRFVVVRLLRVVV